MAIWSPELAATVLLPAFLLQRTKDTETQQVASPPPIATRELVAVFSQILKSKPRPLKASFPSRNILRDDAKICSWGQRGDKMVKWEPSRLEKVTDN